MFVGFTWHVRVISLDCREHWIVNAYHDYYEDHTIILGSYNHIGIILGSYHHIGIILSNCEDHVGFISLNFQFPPEKLNGNEIGI